jgi:ligand-binding sensor domain-containing protein/signal transduction histidine kinase
MTARRPPRRGAAARIAGVWGARGGLLAAVLGAAAPAAAERLAIRTYTTADGLAHDHVQCIVPDSRGFLWLCTASGLSRFDGRRFVNYGPLQGLREPYVNDFVETRRGAYWLATNGAGVYRFDPATTRFEAHPVGSDTATNRVNALVEDGGEALWAGSDDGLFRRAPTDDRFRPVALPVPRGRVQVRALARDAAGAVWIASSAGLHRAAPDGSIEARAPEVRSAYSVLPGRDGGLWAGHASGLLRLDPSGRRVETREDALGRARFSGEGARILLRRADGRLLVGGRNERGLAVWDGRRRHDYTTAHGLSDTVVTALAEDPRGNLWIGTETGGVMRLARNGFVSYGTADGLGHRRAVSIFETRAGELCVLTALRVLNRFDGGGFTAVRPRLSVPPSALTVHGVTQDRAGGWWAATPQGLARYAPADSLAELARAGPAALYTTRHGLVRDDTGRPFEDAGGDLWITVGGAAALTRWERASGTFHHYAEAEGLPAGNLPVAFGEDARGRLWVGFREGGVARRDGGRFQFFGAADGLPAANARSLHRDARGRLWVATTGGGLVEIVDGPGRPRFRRFTTADGLSTDHVRCLTDDGQGRLYLGTAVGVDRFDPERRELRHFTTTDGLAQNEIQTAYRDRHGALWFGTMNGVSRLVPAPDDPAPPASAMIAAVSVAGVPRALSALGERAVPEFTIGPGPVGVRVEYFVTDFTPGRERLFQYRLDAGAEWSAPTTRDAVEYAALAPGRYRFEVRAAGSAAEPATVAFVVRPPVWRRAWFLALSAAVLAALAYRFHRARIERALELERVRTRIATDLHDDIGSNLSQIAIWSEVAARGGVDATMRERLEGVAAACRETVDSMSDIVWAINPAHDRLTDLVHRMRRFATDVFSARDVAFSFEASVPDERTLGTDVRRQVLLVFKEAVHNAVRHSGCTGAAAQVSVSERGLTVVVHDDGRGFDPAMRGDGHGLGSMRARARELGAVLDLRSAPGQGTTVTLVVPHLRR